MTGQDGRFTDIVIEELNGQIRWCPKEWLSKGLWYRIEPEALLMLYRLGVRDGIAIAAGKLGEEAQAIRKKARELREMVEESDARAKEGRP